MTITSSSAQGLHLLTILQYSQWRTKRSHALRPFPLFIPSVRGVYSKPWFNLGSRYTEGGIALVVRDFCRCPRTLGNANCSARGLRIVRVDVQLVKDFEVGERFC
jgi:hypothetical protein